MGYQGFEGAGLWRVASRKEQGGAVRAYETAQADGASDFTVLVAFQKQMMRDKAQPG
jgi:hypothetical protein